MRRYNKKNQQTLNKKRKKKKNLVYLRHQRGKFVNNDIQTTSVKIGIKYRKI